MAGGPLVCCSARLAPRTARPSSISIHKNSILSREGPICEPGAFSKRPIRPYNTIRNKRRLSDPKKRGCDETSTHTVSQGGPAARLFALSVPGEPFLPRPAVCCPERKKGVVGPQDHQSIEAEKNRLHAAGRTRDLQRLLERLVAANPQDAQSRMELLDLEPRLARPKAIERWRLCLTRMPTRHFRLGEKAGTGRDSRVTLTWLIASFACTSWGPDRGCATARTAGGARR